MWFAPRRVPTSCGSGCGGGKAGGLPTPARACHTYLRVHGSDTGPCPGFATPLPYMAYHAA